MATGSCLAAFDVAELPENPNLAVGVLDQEFMTAVLQRQDPPAGFDGESGSA
ncbi:hypothetical protein D3C85_1851850 [compost metagenome]